MRKQFWMDPDKKQLGIAGDGEVFIWNIKTGDSVARLRDHEGEVYEMAFTPDGSRLFTLDSALTGRNPFWGTNNPPAQVHLWDLSTGRTLITLRLAQEPLTGKSQGRYSNMRFQDGKLSLNGRIGTWSFDGIPVK